MTNGINMETYLLRNENWLATGTEGSSGKHEKDGTLTNEEVAVFFSNGHLQEERGACQDEFISRSEFENWYKNNESAISAFLKDEYSNYDYKSEAAKEAVYQGIMDLAQSYNPFDDSSKSTKNNNLKINNRTDVRMPNIKFEVGNNKFIKPGERTNPGGNPNAGSKPDEALPAHVPENYRNLYNMAIDTPASVFNDPTFWTKPGLSDIGKLEIIKASIDANDINDEELIKTLRTHCSEIYANAIKNTSVDCSGIEEIDSLLTYLNSKDITISITGDCFQALKGLYDKIQTTCVTQGQGGTSRRNNAYKHLNNTNFFNIKVMASFMEGDLKYSPGMGKKELEELSENLYNTSNFKYDKDKMLEWEESLKNESDKNRFNKILNSSELTNSEKIYLLQHYSNYDRNSGQFVKWVIDQYYNYNANNVDKNAIINMLKMFANF